MTYICNIGSLILGLLAWMLPVAAMAGKKRPGGYCVCSAAACALALFLQLLELRHRCDIGNVSAVLDTVGGIVFAAEVLLLVAAALNALALVVGKRAGK